MPKVQLTVRLDDSVIDKLKIIAEKERRSINSQYEKFIDIAIEEYEKQNGAIELPTE